MPQDISGTEGFLPLGALQVPVANDNGEEWAEAIEQFMIRLATHKHDNESSVAISNSLNRVTKYTLAYGGEDQTLNNFDKGSWTTTTVLDIKTADKAPDKKHDGGNISLDLDNNTFTFYKKIGATNTYEQFYPKVNRITNQTFTLTTNDNNITEIKAIYV